MLHYGKKPQEGEAAGQRVDSMRAHRRAWNPKCLRKAEAAQAREGGFLRFGCLLPPPPH